LDRATTRNSDDYITLAMKPIYLEAWKIKGVRGAPKRRADFVQAGVTKRNGVWMQVHESIEAAFDKLSENAENAMVARFGEVFDSLHGNFLLLCEKSEAKSDKEKVFEKSLRDELGNRVTKVKEMLDEGGEITKLVAACKAYHAAPAANSQSLFVQQ
jgi:hypothetical protein